MARKRVVGIFVSAAIFLNTVSVNMLTISAKEITYKCFNFTNSTVSEAQDLYNKNGDIPVYDASKGYGFLAQTNAMPKRDVSLDGIKNDGSGFYKTEDGTGSYLHNTNSNNYNNGGLVFRIDVDEVCAYGITVDLAACDSTNTYISVNGTNPARITGSAYWDSAKKVKVQNYAKWLDNDTWQYDFVSAQGYLEIEIEPNFLPTEKNPATVGVACVRLTKIANNQKDANELPTIYVLGDSTEKTYTFEEAASKVWSKIIAEQITAQAQNGGASAQMKELSGYLGADIVDACKSGDWSRVYPEWTDDVSLSTQNNDFYYRNQIEKLLQIGAMQKAENNRFEPEKPISVNDFISSLCAVWGLDISDSAVNSSLEKYYSDEELTREKMAAVILDAYKLRFGLAADGSFNKPAYMTDYNGTTVTPDNPEYDPNLTGAEAQYYPLVGWGNLTDKEDISLEYAEDFYNVYNLGLMRSEKGIERGRMKNGTELEPKAVVTRAKAAKELWFLWVLGQNNVLEENHIDTITDKNNNNKNVVYKPVAYTESEYEFKTVDIASDGTLDVSLKVNKYTENAVLKAVVYGQNGEKIKESVYNTDANGAVIGLDITLSDGQKAELSVCKGNTVLSRVRNVVCTKLIVPVRSYSASTVPGIKHGYLKLANISAESAGSNNITVLSADDEAVWWTASDSVNKGDVFADGFIATSDMSYKALTKTINGITFSGYVAHASLNGKTDGTGSGFEFTPDEDGVLTVYIQNLGANKNATILEAGKSEAEAVASSIASGISGDCCISGTLKAKTTYYITVMGSKGRFMGMSYISGAPVKSVTAKAGETVKITAVPDNGYVTKNIRCTAPDGTEVRLESNAGLTENTFVMPGSNVIISAEFGEGTQQSFIYGDVSGDNVIAADDAAILLQKTLVETFKMPIEAKTDDWLKYADVSTDGFVAADDAAIVMQKTLIETYKMPVETQLSGK